MNTAQLLLIVEDMFFSFIAAFGFGSISNPPLKGLVAAGCLGALGHGLRYLLMNFLGVHIVPASFFSALCVGFLGFACARKMGMITEVLTFPAALPMIPGVPAYNTMISLVKFLDAGQNAGHEHLVGVFSNGFLALFVLSSLVLGILCPYLLFSSVCWQNTRRRKSCRSRKIV